MSLKKERFIREIGPAALAVAIHYKIDPKILIAQAALETGWGQYVIDHNYFNIKGEGKTVETTEYEHGKPKKVQAAFRTYTTVLEAFLDYMNLILTNPRYELLKYLFHSPGDYFVMLQKSGYATDPNYAAKCIATYESIPENWLDIVLEEIEQRVATLI